jgi:hypothetical protein
LFFYPLAVKNICTAFAALFFFFGLQPQAAQANCITSQTHGFSAGSAVSGNRVVICATESSQKATSTNATSTTTGKSKSSGSTPSLPKPVCPTVVRTTEQIVAAALAGCKIPGPSRPPAATTPNVRKVESTATNVSATSQSAQAFLEPQPLVMTASKPVLQVGESVLLTSDATDHEKSAVILGRAGFVRFTPLSYRWSVAGAQDSAVAVAAFSSSGLKPLSLQLTYRASTRFSLAEPWAFVGLVTVRADHQLLVLEAVPSITPKPAPRLVRGSCETWPSNYRC